MCSNPAQPRPLLQSSSTHSRAPIQLNLGYCSHPAHSRPLLPSSLTQARGPIQFNPGPLHPPCSPKLGSITHPAVYSRYRVHFSTPQSNAPTHLCPSSYANQLSPVPCTYPAQSRLFFKSSSSLFHVPILLCHSLPSMQIIPVPCTHPVQPTSGPCGCSYQPGHAVFRGRGQGPVRMRSADQQRTYFACLSCPRQTIDFSFLLTRTWPSVRAKMECYQIMFVVDRALYRC